MRSRNAAAAIALAMLGTVVLATLREGTSAIAIISPLIGLAILVAIFVPLMTRAKRDSASIDRSGALFAEAAAVPVEHVRLLHGDGSIDDQRTLLQRAASPSLVQGYIRIDDAGLHFNPWPRLRSPGLGFRIGWSEIEDLKTSVDRGRAEIEVRTKNQKYCQGPHG